MHTQSVLTITSNVVYGKAHRQHARRPQAGEPFAPGANPMNGRDKHGCVACALSVAKIPYDAAEDGISLTSRIVPGRAGQEPDEQVRTWRRCLDAYFGAGGFHVNINC